MDWLANIPPGPSSSGGGGGVPSWPPWPGSVPPSAGGGGGGGKENHLREHHCQQTLLNALSRVWLPKRSLFWRGICHLNLQRGYQHVRCCGRGGVPFAASPRLRGSFAARGVLQHLRRWHPRRRSPGGVIAPPPAPRYGLGNVRGNRVQSGASGCSKHEVHYLGISLWWDFLFSRVPEFLLGSQPPLLTLNAHFGKGSPSWARDPRRPPDPLPGCRAGTPLPASSLRLVGRCRGDTSRSRTTQSGPIRGHQTWKYH